MKTWVTLKCSNQLSRKEKTTLAKWRKMGVKSDILLDPTLNLYASIRENGFTSLRKLGKDFNVSNVMIFKRLNYLEQLGFIKKETMNGKANIYIYPVPEPQYQDNLPSRRKKTVRDSDLDRVMVYWKNEYEERRGIKFHFEKADYRRFQTLLKTYSADELMKFIFHYFQYLTETDRKFFGVAAFQSRIQSIVEEYYKFQTMKPDWSKLVDDTTPEWDAQRKKANEESWVDVSKMTLEKLHEGHFKWIDNERNKADQPNYIIQMHEEYLRRTRESEEEHKKVERGEIEREKRNTRRITRGTIKGETNE